MTISVIAAALLLLFQTSSKSSIEGFVVSGTTNKPIAGAQITSRKLPDRPPGTAGLTAGVIGGTLGALQDQPTTTTDASGHFVLSNLDAGTYVISASAEGYAQQQLAALPNGQTGMSTSVTVAAGQTANDAVLHLTPGGTISGRVTGGNGEALVGMDVQLVRSTYQIDGRRNLLPLGSAQQTNDRGEYRLFWMPPGKYYLSVSPSPFPRAGGLGLTSSPNNKYPRTYYPGSKDITAATEIDVPAGGELVGIDLRLTPQTTYRIRGSVIDSTTGQFPQNANVTIVPRDGVIGGISGLGNQYNRTNGTFEIRDVIAGSYWVRAQLPLAGPLQAGANGRLPTPSIGIAAVEVTATDIEGVNVVIQPPFSIPGRVRVDGGAPVNLPQIRISLQPPATGFVAFRLPTPPVVNPDGTFVFSDVGPGEYLLNVPLLGGPNAPGMYVKEARLGGADVLTQPIVISGPVSDQFDIVLGLTNARITGTVTDDHQQAAPRAQVFFIPESPERRDLFKTAIANANGQFTLRSVAPGSYTVFAADFQNGLNLDPAVMTKLEQKGQRVTITTSSDLTLNLKLLSTSR